MPMVIMLMMMMMMMIADKMRLLSQYLLCYLILLPRLNTEWRGVGTQSEGHTCGTMGTMMNMMMNMVMNEMVMKFCDRKSG